MKMFACKGKQRKRKNVVITLDPELVENACKLGLNISKVCENSLIQAVKALERVFDENKGGNLGTVGSGLVRGVGFEPTNPYGTAASERALLTEKAKIDWENFEKWLFKEYAPVTARDRLRYARKHHKSLLNGDLTSLMVMSEHQRDHAMKALASLSKFLGIHDRFKQLIKSYGLKWGSKGGDYAVIKRLTTVKDPDEIFKWIIEVKRKAPEYTQFMDLLASTGIRYTEAVTSYNLMLQLASENRLEEYYRDEVLEHFKFKELFIRRSKKLFISFVPETVVKEIVEDGNNVDWSKIRKAVDWRIGRLRFADVREFWSSYMTRYLSHPEIDFLQGRVSSSVFMRNYFNPVWIRDLKERALKGEEEILKQINQELDHILLS